MAVRCTDLSVGSADGAVYATRAICSVRKNGCSACRGDPKPNLYCRPDDRDMTDHALDVP